MSSQALEQIYEVPLSDIRISNWNVRQTDQEVNIDELAESIKKHGLLQPVLLHGVYGRPPYELVVGQRRFRAHEKLGRVTIKARIRPKTDEAGGKIESLAENLHRAPLNHADAAEAITWLFKHYERDERKVAKELSLGLRTVRDYIRIEEQATPKIKKLLKERKVKKEDVKRVLDASAGDKGKADELITEIQKMTTYEKRRLVEFGISHPKATTRTIKAEARRPRIEETVVMNLRPDLAKALRRAAEETALAREDIALRALEDWLHREGFLKKD